jgi:hypothetical protein
MRDGGGDSTKCRRLLKTKSPSGITVFVLVDNSLLLLIGLRSKNTQILHRNCPIYIFEQLHSPQLHSSAPRRNFEQESDEFLDLSDRRLLR